MSFRNWLPYVAIGAGIAISLLIAINLQHYQSDAACSDGRTDQYCQNRHGISPSVRLTPFNHIDEPNAEPYPQRQEWRSERDLEAQWEMAYWAKVAAIAAGFGVVITGIGVILVRQTLAANRAAVEAAVQAIEVTRETARHELRAYLLPKECKLRYEDREPVATVTAINCGQTPAERVMIVGAIFIHERPATFMLASFEQNLSKGRIGRDRSVKLDARLKTPITDAQIEGLEKRTHTLTVAGDIEYTDIFGRVWAQNYEFCTGGKYGPAIRSGRMSISTKDFRERQKA